MLTLPLSVLKWKKDPDGPFPNVIYSSGLPDTITSSLTWPSLPIMDRSTCCRRTRSTWTDPERRTSPQRRSQKKGSFTNTTTRNPEGTPSTSWSARTDTTFNMSVSSTSMWSWGMTKHQPGLLTKSFRYFGFICWNEIINTSFCLLNMLKLYIL